MNIASYRPWLVLVGLLLGCSEGRGYKTPESVGKHGRLAAASSSELTEQKSPQQVGELRIIWTEGLAASYRLRLQNHGPDALRLAPGLLLEREQGGEFLEVAGSRGHLVGGCGDPVLEAAECRTLAVGAELAPDPVYLRTGDMQCVDSAQLPAGRYRWVVRGCDNAALRWTSAAIVQAENRSRSD